MEALMFWISFSYFLSLVRCFKSSLHPTVSISVNSLSLLIRSGRSSMFVYRDATTPVIAPSSPGTGLPVAAA
ncbi:hypothetical protein B0H14DRAFT_3006597 [Mycena olivaceomarginata]|nr:hypothetical protein B0H14DRAFT_3006597 [Mycena olivaceomarginata]